MTRNKLITINIVALVLAMISLAAYLILSNNYKDNIILWIFIPLLIISFIYSIYCNIKEKAKDNNFKITKEIFKSILNLYCKDTGKIYSLIFQIVTFLIIACIYQYGIFVIPMIVFTLINFLVSATIAYKNN